jgi:hypothetical protein
VDAGCRPAQVCISLLDGKGCEKRLQQSYQAAVHAFNAELPGVRSPPPQWDDGMRQRGCGLAELRQGGCQGNTDEHAIEYIAFDFHKARPRGLGVRCISAAQNDSCAA